MIRSRFFDARQLFAIASMLGACTIVDAPADDPTPSPSAGTSGGAPEQRGEGAVDAGTVDKRSPQTDAAIETGAVDAGPPPLDECTRPKPDWVFCDGFEEGGSAPFWDGTDKKPELVTSTGPAGHPANHAVRLRVPPGTGGAGMYKMVPPHDKLYARWYVQWETGHDFAALRHGPGGLAADAAEYLGRSGIRPNGADYVDSTIESVTTAPYRLQAYTYYRGMYMDCSDPNGSCWGDMFPCTAGPGYCTNPAHGPKVTQKPLETGRWYCVEQMIDLGTPSTTQAGASGTLDFWVDGMEIGPWPNLWMRTTSSLKINTLWLYLYHHEQHSPEGMLIDNVVVSTSPIGCL